MSSTRCKAMSQATALIDGNNFYASCEQSLDPSLIGRPLVVLSNNDGCVVARNAERRTECQNVVSTSSEILSHRADTPTLTPARSQPPARR